MIKACIFDLDGVIVDTAKYHYNAWKRLADHLQITFSEAQNEHMKGISRMASLNMLLSLGDKEYSSKDKDKFYLTKNVWYLESVAKMSKEEILPGVLDLLKELKTKNIKVALGSASKNARYILELIGLTDIFDAIVDGNDVSKSKPDPEVFIKAARLLKVTPQDSIVFEDSAKGIDAAIAGGFRTVGIGDKTHLGHADIVIAGFDNYNFERIVDHLLIPSASN